MCHFHVQTAPPGVIAAIKARAPWPPKLLVTRHLTISEACLSTFLVGKYFCKFLTPEVAWSTPVIKFWPTKIVARALSTPVRKALTTYPEKAYSEYAANKHFTFFTKNTKKYQAQYGFQHEEQNYRLLECPVPNLHTLQPLLCLSYEH